METRRMLKSMFPNISEMELVEKLKNEMEFRFGKDKASEILKLVSSYGNE
jgi:hypothetical protein